MVGAGDTSIFPRMIQAHRKGRLRILGNGLNRVDFTSVHNLNDALFSCLLAGEPALGKVYNISNGQPRFVVGAGDTSIFPRMIQAHRKGRLRILGNGLNRVDFTSVHNLNDALFSCLLAGEPALGKVYNISNGQPVPFWDAVNYVMRQLTALDEFCAWWRAQGYGLAALNEGVCRILPGRPEPVLFRLGMAVMAKNFTLDINRAREYLDYDPRVSLWTALDEFCAWWRAQGL